MTRNRIFSVSLAVVLTAAAPAASLAGDEGHEKHSQRDHAAGTAHHEDPAPMSDETVVAEQLPTYPLSVCPVSGQKLGKMGDPVNHVHDGRLVRFCCGGCLDTFSEDPAAFLAKIDAAAAGAGEEE